MPLAMNAVNVETLGTRNFNHSLMKPLTLDEMAASHPFLREQDVMSDPTLAELLAKIEDHEKRIAKEEASPSFWQGLDERIKANPKIMVFVSMLLTFIGTWASTYFSVPATRDVPGPKETITTIHNVPVPGPTIIKEIPVEKAKPKEEPPPVPPTELDVSLTDDAFAANIAKLRKSAPSHEWYTLLVNTIAMAGEGKSVGDAPDYTPHFKAIADLLKEISGKLDGKPPVPPQPPPVDPDAAIKKLQQDVMALQGVNASLTGRLALLEARVAALEGAKPPPIPVVAAHVTFIGAEKSVQATATNNDPALREWFATNKVKVHVLKADDPGIEAAGFTTAVKNAGGAPAVVLQAANGKILASGRMTTSADMMTFVQPFLSK